MPQITSFYHAIYKRLWAVGQAGNAHKDGPTAYGGLSLASPGEANGLFGTIGSDQFAGPSPFKAPFKANDNSALYGLLRRSPDRQTWPVRPFPFNNSIARKAGPAPFPLAQKERAQILFVCSMAGDNGVRPGSVPADWWHKAQIFVCDASGQSPAKDLGLPLGKAGETRTVLAIIGNSGNLSAGALFPGLPAIDVICNAHVFNTFMSDSTPLPALSPLDTGATYEQPVLAPGSYGVAGFRFDVDAVFKGLRDAMTAHGYTLQQLGGLTVDEWLKAGHACVKVLITGGELPNNHNRNGWPDDKTSPSADRHIAQRNLAPFDMTAKGARALHWQTFMMSQAGAGLNALSVQSMLPADAARYSFALPTAMFDRYVAQGGKLRGFERVSDVAKPFPDAVILRESAPGARLEIADHRREIYFGMALGVEWEPARLARMREPGAISVSHAGADGKVVGGFTLQPQVS
jgi:hypothetical protein